MSLIEIKDVSYSYNDSQKAIDGVSFDIKKGDYVTIIGHNGSGKSTLAKLIAGLLPVKQGEIVIDGLTVNEENISKIREELGIVFQNPDNQFIGSTVEDDIAFGLENREFPHDQMQEEIEKYAASVNMLDYLKKEPINLSGGQKQRVALAGALILKPDILILDEATSMLDPKGKATVRKYLDRIHKENPDLTIISITHDVDEALLADKVFILSKGKLVKDGKPQDILRDEKALLDLKLEMPFIYRVEKKLSEACIDSQAETMEQLVEDIWASR